MDAEQQRLHFMMWEQPDGYHTGGNHSRHRPSVSGGFEVEDKRRPEKASPHGAAPLPSSSVLPARPQSPQNRRLTLPRLAWPSLAGAYWLHMATERAVLSPTPEHDMKGSEDPAGAPIRGGSLRDSCQRERAPAKSLFGVPGL
ncbi:unnamed protein product [Boreogadus saida]